MNYLEAAKVTATVESFLSALWQNHPKAMRGHGVRLGADGRPEVFVAFDQPIEVPAEVNGVRIVSEVRPPAYFAVGKEHKLKAHQCSDCSYEFVIVSLNKPQEWKNVPYCSECGSDEHVAQIDCLDFRMTEKIQQYEIAKSLKPIPGA